MNYRMGPPRTTTRFRAYRQKMRMGDAQGADSDPKESGR
jgi:hypothetical protein